MPGLQREMSNNSAHQAQGYGAVIQQPVQLPPQNNFNNQQPFHPGHHSQPSFSELPPLRPVFGVSLDTLLDRDKSAVPIIVYQCIQAVDLYGLDVEGIYRLSGTNSHVQRIKNIFDNGETNYLFLLQFRAFN